MKPYCCALMFAGLASVCWAQGQAVTVEIPANQSWTNTGVFVNPGETVLVEARGVIEAVSPADTRPMFHRVPPAGRPERQSNKPQPNMPALVMLARLGDGPVLEAGSRAELQAGDSNGSGELQLGINDDYVADNTGSWTARITVRSTGFISQQRRSRPDADTASRRRDLSPGIAAIQSKEQQIGNLLGPATAHIRVAADGIGRYREYQNGVIYWSPDTGAHEVRGSIRDEWMRRGAESGDLGYPTSDELPSRDGRSRMNRFERGVIRWNAQSGARVEQTQY